MVLWPWENHVWERLFVQTARQYGTRTLGYQHSTIGTVSLNHSQFSNPDGLENIPDTIISNGPVSFRRLREWGIPENRLVTGGALRFRTMKRLSFDPNGPVFVALSHHPTISRQMLDAISLLAMGELRFLIKSHPMRVIPFKETVHLQRCETGLNQQDGLSAVLYSSSTVGVEAILGGIPTLRFQPKNYVDDDIIPDGWPVVSVHAGNLGAALENLEHPPEIKPEAIFSPVDMTVWKGLLQKTD